MMHYRVQSRREISLGTHAVSPQKGDLRFWLADDMLSP
jgi:hypothetical protein